MAHNQDTMLYRRLRLVVDLDVTLNTGGVEIENKESDKQAMAAFSCQPQAVIDAILMRYVLQELATVDADDLAELAGAPSSETASEALLDKVLAVSGISDEDRESHVDSLITNLDSFLGLSVRQLASVDAPTDPYMNARARAHQTQTERSDVRVSMTQH